MNVDIKKLTDNPKFQEYLQAWQLYCAMEKKHEEDVKKMAENLQKEIEKQDALNEKLVMMREHPEWFKVTSPKEYGMNLNKRKYGNRRKH